MTELLTRAPEEYNDTSINKMQSVEVGSVEKNERAALNSIDKILYGGDLGGGNGEKLTASDFDSLHENFELLASETDFFDKKEDPEGLVANGYISDYVRTVRLFVATSPDGGDILAASGEGSRNSLRTYLAVESAISGDFDDARDMLVDIDADTEGAFERVLLNKLQEAKEASESGMGATNISPESSAAALERKIDKMPSEEIMKKVEASDPRITIGTTLDVLSDMVSPGGRYMTTHEVNVLSAGRYGTSSVDSRTGKYSQGYGESRRRVESQYGYSSNPFTPRVVYGALTSELEPDRASGYGPVTIHLRPEVSSDPSTGFNLGDSMSLAGRSGDAMNYSDALTAYASNVESILETGGSRYSYVEAHVQGMSLEKIDKVSIQVDSEGLRDIPEVIDTVDECIQRGLQVEIVMDMSRESGRWVQLGVEHYMEQGMDEGAAIDKMHSTLKSRLKSPDSPQLTMALFFEKGGYRGFGIAHERDRANKQLFAERGIAIREPELEGSLVKRPSMRIGS